MSRILILFFVFFSSYYALSQHSTGLIPIERFNSDKLGAQPHCFAFAQDARDAIYVGNKDGLLVYTGVWRKYITNNATEIRALTVGYDGNIYIGNQNGFGYFTPNDTGIFTYYPLDTMLTKEQRSNIENTQIVVSKDSAIYFNAGKSIQPHLRSLPVVAPYS